MRERDCEFVEKKGGEKSNIERERDCTRKRGRESKIERERERERIVIAHRQRLFQRPFLKERVSERRNKKS